MIDSRWPTYHPNVDQVRNGFLFRYEKCSVFVMKAELCLITLQEFGSYKVELFDMGEKKKKIKIKKTLI